jgi:hypothetical protein
MEVMSSSSSFSILPEEKIGTRFLETLGDALRTRGYEPELPAKLESEIL